MPKTYTATVGAYIRAYGKFKVEADDVAQAVVNAKAAYRKGDAEIQWRAHEYDYNADLFPSIVDISQPDGNLEFLGDDGDFSSYPSEIVMNHAEELLKMVRDYRRFGDSPSQDAEADVLLAKIDAQIKEVTS